MTWWETDPLLFEDFKKKMGEFPFLALLMKNKTIFLRGNWPVHGVEKLIKTYQISIEIPDDFPNSTPKVFEVGEIIPKTLDRHFNSKDETACLFIKTEQLDHWPLGSSIDLFLNKPVKEFFFSQACYELTGEWPFGYWDHGERGLMEYCMQYLQISKMEQLIIFFRYLKLKRPAILYCPCGNRKQFKLCHWHQFKSLRSRLPVKDWLAFRKN